VQPQRVGGHTMAPGCPVTSQGEGEYRRDGLFQARDARGKESGGVPNSV
jgi:hypothetical protein